MSRRPLTLHVSALSNAEYASYTESFAELATPPEDADWERIVLSVREVRGWIRGRFGATVDGAIIDQILKLFCPDLGPQDVLTGGQFFAVLRLINHVQAGQKVDVSMVFVQIQPNATETPNNTISRHPDILPPSARAHSKSTPPPPPPPPPPRPSADHTSALPSTASATSSPALPPRTPNSAYNGPNPFLRSQSQSGILPKTDSPSNPFRLSAQKLVPPKSVSSTSSASLSSSPPKPTPPLPPRKITVLPPPLRHGSLARSPPAPPPLSSKASIYSTPPLPPPSGPPKPPKVTSPLIKQSLQAAKGAQSVKEVLDSLSKERRLEVIKKSGMNGGVIQTTTRTSSAGSTRSVSPPPSFYDVAAATVGRQSSPTRMSSGSSTSNDRRQPSVAVLPASPDTPAASVSRSLFAHQTPSSPLNSIQNPRRTRSLHHPSPSNSPTSTTTSHPPPIPPPRRRRPESVQVTRSPFADGVDDDVESRRPGTAQRHSSFSVPQAAAGVQSTMDALQRKFANLRPGPGFDSVRVRAEGRMLPHGYAKVGREGERLVDDMDEGDDQESSRNAPLPSGRSSRDYREQQRTLENDITGESDLSARDDLKLPMRPGEGWVAL